MRAQRFNLVEIVIALGIVAIGVTAVMGFLPVGLNASRDAIADNYAADSSEQLLHYLSSNIQEDWSQLDLFDSVPPNVAAGSGDLSTWTVIPDTNIYEKNFIGKTVYRILQQTDGIVATTVVDFDAMVRIWKTPTAAWEYDGSAWVTTTDSDYDKRALLNLEMSWPAAVNFGARRKTYYAIEVAKP